MDATIYLVTYKGQWDGKEGESPYTHMAFSLSAAMSLLIELEEQYPDRVWTLEEKDVS